MNWIGYAPVLAAALLLILQGCSYLLLEKSARHNRCAGVLTIVLAALGIVLFVSLATGAIVISPEFRVVMAEGTPAHIGLAILIVGLCVASGLGWHTVRCVKNRQSRGLRILTLGAICGLLAVTRIRVLSPEDGVLYFDRWCPILVIWLAVCLSESLTTYWGIKNRWARVWGNMLLPVLLALYVVYRSSQPLHYADPWSLPFWEGCLLLGLPAVLALGTFLAIELVWVQTRSMRRGFVLLVSAGVGAAGLISAASWVYVSPKSALPAAFRPWFLSLAWLVLLVLLVSRRLYSGWREGKVRPGDLGAPGRLDDVMAMAALTALAAALADVLHFSWLEPVWDLTIMVFAWVVLLEVVLSRPLLALVHRPWLNEICSRLRAAARKTLETVRWLGTGIGKWIRWLFKAKSVAGAMLKVLAGLVLLVALFEIPNARKTIVLPFSTPDLSQEDMKIRGDLGRVISDRIVNTLGLLGQELQPDLTIYAPTESKPGAKKDARAVTVMSEDTGGLQAEVKGVDVDVLGTKIPLGLLTVPIVEPMRRILGVRVIHGSLLREGNAYVLVASSTWGETWRASGPAAPASPEASASGGAARSASPATGTNDSESSEAIAALADEIAYAVMSSDSALARFGMTKSWRALQQFREGAEALREYESEQDFGALANSILQFRKAVQTDPEFALAYYRLGRALAEDGQPKAAIQAYDAALGTNPRFAAAHLALADTYSGAYGYLPLPPGFPEASSELAEGRSAEVRAHWRLVIQLSRADASSADRAAAYGGLCRDSVFALGETYGVNTYPAAYLTFFYCKRAEQLYARLSPSLRAGAQARTAEAAALFYLGVSLEIAGRKPDPVLAEVGQKEAEWHCSWDTVTDEDIADDGTIMQRRLWSSLFARQSLRYYRYARALLPWDPVIDCAVASQSLCVNDPRPMEELAQYAYAHSSLAADFSQIATTKRLIENPSLIAAGSGHITKASSYRLALTEYERAIGLAPMDVDALNNYAYTFCQWRRDFPLPSMLGPDAEVADQAEEFARRAVRLTAGTSNTRQAEVRSTLGKVMLTKGDANKAIEELETAYSKVKESKHAYFNEIRLDLVRAHGCRRDPRVLALLTEIRDSESAREEKPFTEYLDRVDAGKESDICRQTGGM
jgi:tetratricopeptide (TPR) repeat protein